MRYLALITIAFIFLACGKKDITTTESVIIATPVSNTSNSLAALNLPETPYNYTNLNLPVYLTTPNIQQQINTPANNPITNWGATLGRVLFYDKSLSINKTISCASCHKQENAFSDVLALSKGFNGGLTGRNSMALTDAKYYPNGRFFWDERANTLEAQVLLPIQDHIEMGMNLDTLVNRLRNTAHYPVLFQNAFGNTAITNNSISLSLAQFVRSIVSYNSKYDSGRVTIAVNQNPGATSFNNFTVAENRGKEIFFNPQLSSCAGCHGTETFSATRAENNGLDLMVNDRGVGAVINNRNLEGAFKVGSLRNIALTAPYMHDGRFTTLEQVVEHYSTGVKASPTLSPMLRVPGGSPRNLNLSSADKAALVAFLKTLTDRSIATDAKYSNPFRIQ